MGGAGVVSSWLFISGHEKVAAVGSHPSLCRYGERKSLSILEQATDASLLSFEECDVNGSWDRHRVGVDLRWRPQCATL